MVTEPSGESADLARGLGGIAGLALRPGEPLAAHSTLQIGGPAELYVEIESVAALERLLAQVRALGAPFQILGLGSNILFPDEGLAGIVGRLAGDFRSLTIDGSRVTAGAALALSQVAHRTAQAGLVGLEALAGFPSTVGGAVYMNAGCYGTEIADVLASAELVDPDGTVRRVSAADLEPAYRRTNLRGTATIVTEAVFDLAPGDAAAAVARIDELNRKRWQSLPSGVPNAGSIFRNPPGDYAGRLLEACQLKGETRGGALISPKHANVIVNQGGATAADVLGLMLTMRRAVRQRFGVELEPELVLTGRLAAAWRADRI